MNNLRNRPVLIRKVQFRWYALALLPLAGLLWLGLARILPAEVALLALFAFVFWLTSLAGAIWTTLRQPKEPKP